MSQARDWVNPKWKFELMYFAVRGFVFFFWPKTHYINNHHYSRYILMELSLIIWSKWKDKFASEDSILCVFVEGIQVKKYLHEILNVRFFEINILGS